MPQVKNQRELSKIDKICLTAAFVLGKGYHEDCFRLAHSIETDNERSFKVMLSRWLNTPKALELKEEILSRKRRILAETNQNDLRTRSGIIDELISGLGETKGRDTVSGLQTLAKLQGFDKPEEDEVKKDKRVYYLPYISACKTCKLMAKFRELLKEQEETKND